MTGRMSVERVAEIKARVETATEGPWDRNGRGGAGWRIDSLGTDRVGLAFLLNPVALVPTLADVEFIAAARSDVPDLLAALEAAEREIARLESGVEEIANLHTCAEFFHCQHARDLAIGLLLSDLDQAPIDRTAVC